MAYDYKGDEKPTVIEEGGVTQVFSKDGAIAEQIELEPTFGQKLKNHFKRFWWLHVIIFCCCFLIVILPVVYVAYPRIAQHGVTNSRLTLNSLVLSDPYTTHCHIELDQVLSVHSPFKPKLFEFPANLSLPGRGSDRPFMSVTVPQTVAKDGQKVIVDQHTDFPSVEEFTRYTTAVMQNEDLEVIVYGRPKLRQGGLPKITVTYNQTVKMKGLNKLKGFQLTNMTMDISKAEHEKRDESGIMGLLGSALSGSSNSSTGLLGSLLGGGSSNSSDASGDSQHGLLASMAGKMLNFDVPFTAIADIPNPTVMTLYLGNVTTWPMVNGSAIGRSIIHDVILRPGNNNKYNVTGTMNIAQALPALHGTKLDIQILSNESIWHGRNLTYFGDALATNLLEYSVELSEVLKNSLPGMGSLL